MKTTYNFPRILRLSAALAVLGGAGVALAAGDYQFRQPLAGVAAPAPSFSVTPTSLTFPSLEIGQSATQYVVVQNMGSGAGAIPRTLPPEPFSLSDGECGATLEPSRGCAMEVRFSPTAAGQYAGGFTLAGTPVSLSGSVVAPAEPVAQWSGAFGSNTAYSTSGFGDEGRYYYLRNVGAGVLSAPSITMTGDDGFTIGTIRSISDAGTVGAAVGCNSATDGYARLGCRAADDVTAADARKHLRIQVWYNSYNPNGSKAATMTVKFGTEADAPSTVLNFTAN